MSLFVELKRRNVIRVGIAYALAAWVLLQVIDFVLDAISAPNWVLQVFVLAAAVGLPVVLVFSWVYEVTPEGIKREKDIDRAQSITPETGRKLDRVIIATLALAVVLLLADRFVSTQAEPPAPAPAAQHETAEPEEISPGPATPEAGAASGTGTSAISGRSVAVLPFLAMSSGPDDGFFADGLTEEILNALSQLPELLVTARTSAFHFKGQDLPVQQIAAQLGVAHIVEGSVRRAGERLRVTAQLIRAADGFHLWSQNYDSTSEDTIAVQEDIAEKVALAMNVVMDETKREAMRRSGLRDPEAFVEFQKGRELFEKAHGGENQIELLRQANPHFEAVLQRVPTFTPAYRMHSDLYIHVLINDATDMGDGKSPEQELTEALGKALQDYHAAVEHAHTPEDRDNLELDLAFLEGNWRGMQTRVERFLDQSGCDEANWAENMALAFDYASRLVPRNREIAECDPMYSTAWYSLARAQLWAGDAEGAAATARGAMETAPGGWLSLSFVYALAAQGLFEEADEFIAQRLTGGWEEHIARAVVAGARGDREETTRLLGEYLAGPQLSGFLAVSVHAWAGDREGVNRLAGRIDQHPFGAVGLTIAMMWCACGSPWELSATPNYAALLKESGLPWPPPSPMKFPLKDW